MPRHLLLLFLLLPALAFAQNLSSSADLSGLFSLRASLGLRARDWPRKADPCSQWVGVGCRNGRVVSIDLHGLERTRLGRLHPQFDVDGLQQLKRLETFNASGFALPGPIPIWFGTLLPSSFSALDLSGASVNDSIPESLGGAAGLRFLSLAGNFISGAVPLSLGQLSNLTYLDLSSNSLNGTIPPDLEGLSNLTYLDLSSNALQGPIPLSLGNLTNLRTLDLHSNSIGGSIPLELGNLSRLIALDLSLNALTGSLPGALFSGASQLQNITLKTNAFSGALPDSLWSLQGLQSVDFSHNNLTGSLPDNVSANAGSIPNGTAVSFNLSYNFYYGDIPEGFENLFARFSSVDLSENYFQGLKPISATIKELNLEGNCFRNATNQRSTVECQFFYASKQVPYDGPVSPAPASAPASSGPSRRKSGWSVKYILIGLFSGIVFLLIVVMVIIFCIRRCGVRTAENREISRNTMPSGVAQNPSVPLNLSAIGDSFTYDQLVNATSGFSEKNLIKHGHSGDLYRGNLENGSPVVVKRIDLLRFRKESYTVELDVFVRASHARLVPLLGHCLEDENVKFLVYKFMPNRDLSNSLFMKKGPESEGLKSLDWITRLKIATGVAEALCFLHHQCNPPLVHRDIQASSILLDDKFEVRLGSLSELCPHEGDGHQSVITRILRLSHPAESSSSGSSSQMCSYDVYCFGKVLLELITGKLGISGSGDSTSVEWLDHSLQFISIYDKELVTKIVDPSLIVDEDHLEEVWAMAVVAKSCLNPKPSKRPPIRYILKALENPLKVVREENSSGSGPLRTTSSRGSWNIAFFGSRRHSSNDTGAQQREDRSGGLKQSGTSRSQGSTEEQQHPSHQKKPSKDIYPEPSVVRDTNDGQG